MTPKRLDSSRIKEEEFVPLQSFQDSTYQRLNQKWVCGQECGSCALGPTVKGDCQAGFACQPKKHSDTWICNRSKLQSGECTDGPTAEGQCCQQIQPCAPTLEMRHRRFQFVFWCVAGLIGLGTVTLNSDWRNEVLAPGGLTEQHAQLLRDKNSDRCAECHGAGSMGLSGWSVAAITPIRSLGKTQGQLCMDCHDKSISAESAMLAHSMPLHELAALSQDSKRRLGSSADRLPFDASSEIACSTCHQEHHGAAFDLTAVTNAQCATCHQDQFVDFASSHPTFGDWPYARRTRIAFDHVAHQSKYFPEAKRGDFDCRMCHDDGGRTGIVAVSNFENACASCHEKKIEQGMSGGLQMLALPMLDVAALRSQGLSVGEWPAGAAGSFDGPVAPLMRLLLGSDRRAWAALEQFGPEFDFLDIDSGNIDDLEAAHNVAWGIKQLVFDLATDTRETFQARLERSLRTTIPKEQAEALSAHLSPALVGDLQRRWFPSLMKEVPAYRRKIGVPPNRFEGDSVVSDNLVVGRLPVASPLGSAGGKWMRDDETFELVMVPKKHASAFLHSWIELLVSNSERVLPETAWPLRNLLTKDSAIGQCVTCHSIDAVDRNHLRINWHGGDTLATANRAPQSLTKFVHGSHLIQPGLEKCTSCHQLDSSQSGSSSYDGTDPLQCVSNFAPMLQQDCARCHHAKGAGDSCLKCHEYHSGGHAESLSKALSAMRSDRNRR